MTGFPQWSNYVPSFPRSAQPPQWLRQEITATEQGNRRSQGFPQSEHYRQFMEGQRSFGYVFPPPRQSFYQPSTPSQVPPISDSELRQLEQSYGVQIVNADGQPYFQDDRDETPTPGSVSLSNDPEPDVATQQFSAQEVLKPGAAWLTTPSSDTDNDFLDTLQVFDIREMEKYVDGEQWIDTGLLAKAIDYELRTRGIPQTSFATNVINRSQGTLSDLIRNPKPWEEMKSGRDTFRMMMRWLKMNPDARRRAAAEGMPSIMLVKGSATRKFTRKAKPDNQGPAKKKRLVFTELQKRTLQKIFHESQNPSKQMMEIVGQRLGLTFGTVQNYFMNARRKAKMEREAEE